MPGGLLHGKEGRTHIDGHGLVKIGLRKVLDQRMHQSSGIVDKNVEAAKLLYGFPYGRLQSLDISAVGLEGKGRPAIGGDLVDEALGGSAIGGIGKGDMRALFRKLANNGSAYATRPTGDNGAFVEEGEMCRPVKILSSGMEDYFLD